MNVIEEAIATLGIPGSIAIVLLVIFALLQLIGEFIEAFGKVAPAALKVRKVVANKIDKKKKRDQLYEDVKNLLADVDEHYNADNIAKRDAWITWVNSRADTYDKTIVTFTETLNKLTTTLEDNTKMTEHMFIESSRDRIIDFASKVSNIKCPVSREEFNRIFKVYTKYEQFLEERGMTNGEVEVNYQIIKDAYKEHTEKHSFVEDLKK